MSASNVISPNNNKIYDSYLPNPYPFPAQANDLAQVLLAGNDAGNNDIVNVNEIDANKFPQATAKGSLMVGDGINTNELQVGTDTFVLKANSLAPYGVEWAADAAGVTSVSAGNNITIGGTASNPSVALSSPITTQIDMGNLKIVNCLDPTSAQDVATKNYTDGKVGSVSAGNNITIGGTATNPSVALSSPITTQIDMGNLKIVNCLDPTSAQDVATKSYVDAASSGAVTSVSAGNNITIGGTATNPSVALSSPITTQIDMGNLKIVNLLDPTSAQDGASKNYVDTYYYSAASAVNPFGYSTGTTFVCGQILTVVIPSGWNTFDIETYASSLFSNVPTNNGGQAIVRYGTTSPSLASTTVPAGTLTLVPQTDIGLNNVQSSTQSLISFKGDLAHLYINANTILTPGTTYYFSVWGKTITAVTINYNNHYIYVKAFRKS